MRHLPAVLLAAALCAIYAPTLGSAHMLMWDEAEYATIGRSIVRGEGFAIGGTPNSLRAPLVPLVASAAIALAGRADDGVLRAPKLAFAALALLAVYACTAVVHGRATGLVALVLLGVTPAFWLATPFFLSELPFLAFFTGAIVTFFLGLHRHPRYFLLAWVLWGVAFLTRYTAVLFAPIALVSLAIAARRTPLATLARSRVFLLAPLAGLAIVAPWMLRQQIAFGDAFAGARIASTALQLFAPNVSMPWYFYLARLPAMLSPGILIAAVAGVVWAIRNGDGFGLHCAAACGVLLVWFSCYRFKEDRQMMALLPLAASLGAVGLTKLWPFGASATHRLVILATLGVLSFVTVRPVLASSVTLGYPSFLDAMRWLQAHSAPDATVLGPNPAQIAWYADRRVEAFPDETRLPDALGRTEWTVVTSFERAQPRYAAGLAARVTTAEEGEDARVFADRRFTTTIIRSRVLLRQP